MYRNENFTEVGRIREGEVILRLPGTNLGMPYSAGTGYVNEARNVAHLALTLKGLTATESGESADGMLGMLGEQMREQMAAPEVQQLVATHIVGKPLHLFYSLISGDKRAVITLPGMSGEYQVDPDNNPHFVVAAYKMAGIELPTVDEVFGFHSQAVGDRNTISNRTALEAEVLTLADKANDVYKSALNLMRGLDL